MGIYGPFNSCDPLQQEPISSNLWPNKWNQSCNFFSLSSGFDPANLIFAIIKTTRPDFSTFHGLFYSNRFLFFLVCNNPVITRTHYVNSETHQTFSFLWSFLERFRLVFPGLVVWICRNWHVGWNQRFRNDKQGVGHFGSPSIGRLTARDLWYLICLLSEGGSVGRWVMFQPESSERTSANVLFLRLSDLKGQPVQMLFPQQRPLVWKKKKNGSRRRQCHFLSDSYPFVA